MIDNYAQAMELGRQIQMQLPIPAYPTKVLVQTMTRRGVKLTTTQELSIKSVLYLGDEGGIMCDITPSGQRDPIICSLTHLEITTSHLLGAAIHAYQQHRINRLADSGGPRKPLSFTIKPRKKRRH